MAFFVYFLSLGSVVYRRWRRRQNSTHARTLAGYSIGIGFSINNQSIEGIHDCLLCVLFILFSPRDPCDFPSSLSLSEIDPCLPATGERKGVLHRYSIIQARPPRYPCLSVCLPLPDFPRQEGSVGRGGHMLESCVCGIAVGSVRWRQIDAQTAGVAWRGSFTVGWLMCVPAAAAGGIK